MGFYVLQFYVHFFTLDESLSIIKQANTGVSLTANLIAEKVEYDRDRICETFALMTPQTFRSVYRFHNLITKAFKFGFENPFYLCV